MQKQDYTPDQSELVTKLDDIKRLKVKLQTEKDIIIKRKERVLEKLKLVNIPEDLSGYVDNLKKTLTDELNKLTVPEDIENELREFRNSSGQ